MAKETQKAKIDRLQNQIESQKKLIDRLNNEIFEFTRKANEEFENSPTFRQMKKRIEELEIFSNALNKQFREQEDKISELRNSLYIKMKENESLMGEVSEIKDAQRENNVDVKNVRGAGRKPRFTKQERETVKLYRIQGKTMREIADLYGCSVGLIHKLINTDH